MVMTDPISDMLTRIRNANRIKSKYVEIPISKIKMQITDILKEEGYISNYKILKDSNFSKNKKIRIFLKYYDKEKRRSLNGLRRISKPGLRVYVKSHQVPRVLSGLGIAIISTSKGLVTDKQARKESIGGEVLAYIW